MMPASHPLVILLVLAAVLALAAGCSSPAPSPDIPDIPGLPTTAPTPAEIPALPYTNLSEIALTRAEVPFAVIKEDGGVTTLPKNNPGFPTYGATRGYQVYYADNVNDLPLATALRQQILEYPAGSAAPAYQQLLTQITGSAGSNYRIVPYPDIAIGDESYGLIGVNKSGSDKENPSSLILFRKGDVVETITMKSTSGEIGPSAAIARKAASKIPGGIARGTVTVTRTPDPSLQPGVDLVYPVRATASSADTIGKLTFRLRMHNGGKPVDMSRMKFLVSEGAARNSTNLMGIGDPGVQYRWQKSVGGEDRFLSDDEIVMVELDLGAMGFTQSPETINRGLLVYASDVNSPTLGFRWCRDLPAILAPGTGYLCTQ